MGLPLFRLPRHARWEPLDTGALVESMSWATILFRASAGDKDGEAVDDDDDLIPRLVELVSDDAFFHRVSQDNHYRVMITNAVARRLSQLSKSPSGFSIF